MMTELSAKSIANLLPGSRAAMQHAAEIFNETFRYRWERIVDFLKLHYLLSRRTDASFWIDNRRNDSIPDSLRAGLEYWRHHCPWHEDFKGRREEVFFLGQLSVHSVWNGISDSKCRLAVERV